MIRATTLAVVATPGAVTLVDAAARAVAIGIRIATCVMCQRRISTPTWEGAPAGSGARPCIRDRWR